VNLVIQISRLSDGTRKVTQVSEITGMEGDIISMHDIFVFERDSVRDDGKVLGRFKATGVRPKCADRLATAGTILSPSLFNHIEVVA
jgi:pilus assembly protein CpaF